MRLAALLCLITLAVLEAQTPAGKWISNLKYFDQNNYERFELQLDGSKLTGKVGSEGTFEGTFANGVIDAIAKPNPGQTVKVHGRLNGDTITGTATIVEWKVDFQWEAHRDLSPTARRGRAHWRRARDVHGHRVHGGLAARRVGSWAAV